MQLDVVYILRKLNFLDAALSKLLEKHELSALYLRKKQTLEKAKKQRKKHFSFEIVKAARIKEELEMKKDAPACAVSNQQIMMEEI